MTKAPDTLPRDHEGQMHIALDRSPIEDVAPRAVLYFDAASRKAHYLDAKIIRDLGSLHLQFGDLLDVQNFSPLMEKVVAEMLRKANSGLETDGTHEKIARQLFRGQLARVLHIESNGGNTAFRGAVMSGNRLHRKLGSGVYAFLKQRIHSAAFHIMMDAKHRYISERCECLWHNASSPTAPDELIQVMNSHFSLGLMLLLSKEVIPEKKGEVMQSFAHSSKHPDGEWKITGKQLAEWGMAHILDSERTPSATFEDITGIRIDELSPDSRVRRFVEYFDAYIDNQDLRRPWF